VRVRIGASEKEYTLVGVIKAKADQVALRAYINAPEFKKFVGIAGQNASEIAIDLREQSFDTELQALLLGNGFGEGAKIQTHDQATPKFVEDIQNTFSILGNAIGSIGIIVACITLFIVIFINAVTRRKFIGILKGIGIDERSIEYSYVLQSIFYATVGSAVGLLLTYGFLVPFFAANPIDFPFSNGILVAPVVDTTIKVLVLVTTTIIAGYIPAKLIIRQNTLNAILGR
jgi:ABC-type antimicrobial peptide transport system permease subunit